MISEITAGGSGFSTIGRTQPVEAPVKIADNNRKPAGEIAADVSNIKDLKVAELRGQSFSIGEETQIKMIEQANKALEGRSTSFEFSIHEGTKEIMVKVLDKESGQVIREIPSEKVLDMVAKLWEMSGLIVDERR